MGTPAPYIAISNVDNAADGKLFFSSLQHPCKDVRYSSLGNTNYRNVYGPEGRSRRRAVEKVRNQAGGGHS